MYFELKFGFGAWASGWIANAPDPYLGMGVTRGGGRTGKFSPPLGIAALRCRHP